MDPHIYNLAWDPAVEDAQPYRCQWFREGKIPGIICDLCGQTWSLVSGRRLARPLPEDPELRRLLRPKPVPVSDHGEIYERLRSALNLDDDIPLFPGLDVGLGTVSIAFTRLPDFIWPTPWTLLISRRAKDLLEKSSFRGFEIVPIGLKGMEGTADSGLPPELFELTITGKGGSADPSSGITVLERCYVCGFARYSPFSHGLRVNPSWWDGSDFFLLEEYPTYVLVSERAKGVLETSGLQNIRFIDAETLPYVGAVKKA